MDGGCPGLWEGGGVENRELSFNGYSVSVLKDEKNSGDG